MLKLRPYQIDGIERTRRCIMQGKRRVVFVAATGSGKTVCAASIVYGAVQKNSRVLFVAHRRELIRQSFCKVVRSGISPAEIGIIMAGSRLTDPPESIDPDALDDEELWRRGARTRQNAPIQIASIDTLRNRKYPPAELVIIDECHRSLSASYMKLLEVYPKAVHIGLTATPWRADGRGLDEYYDDLVVISSPAQLIAEGFLLEPIVYGWAEKADLSSVRTVGHDYDDLQLAKAIDKPRLVGNIVDHWIAKAKGLRTVAFPTSIAHSLHIVERFKEAGFTFEHLDGSTPTRDRDAILSRLNRHEIDGVSSCDALSEGWDQPAVACAILAKPTKSATKYLQKAGRILRPCEGKLAPILLDHAGCIDAHGFPQDEREYSLEPPQKKRSVCDGPKFKQCPGFGCLCTVPLNAQVCPACGHIFGACTMPGEELKEADGELVIRRPVSVDEKRAVWDSLCRAASEKGYSPGWAKHRYKLRFGVMPPAVFGVPKVDRSGATEEEKILEMDRLEAIAISSGYDPRWATIRFRAKYGCFPPSRQKTERREWSET